MILSKNSLVLPSEVGISGKLARSRLAQLANASQLGGLFLSSLANASQTSGSFLSSLANASHLTGLRLSSLAVGGGERAMRARHFYGIEAERILAVSRGGACESAPYRPTLAPKYL